MNGFRSSTVMRSTKKSFKNRCIVLWLKHRSKSNKWKTNKSTNKGMNIAKKNNRKFLLGQLFFRLLIHKDTLKKLYFAHFSTYLATQKIPSI